MSSLVDLYRELPGKMVTFDLTGLCNLSCSMCVWHNGRMKDAPKKHLDFEKFKLTIDELVENKIGYDCINLSVSGEPTINPWFKDIIKYLFEVNTESRRFFRYIM